MGENNRKTKTHDLSSISKTVLTDLYGPFSRSAVFLIFSAFFSRRYGAKADIAPVRYIIEACECVTYILVGRIIQKVGRGHRQYLSTRTTKVEEFKLCIR